MILFLLSASGGNGQTSLRRYPYSVCHHRSPAEETGQQEKHAGIHACHTGWGTYWLKVKLSS